MNYVRVRSLIGGQHIRRNGLLLLPPQPRETEKELKAQLERGSKGRRNKQGLSTFDG